MKKSGAKRQVRQPTVILALDIGTVNVKALVIELINDQLRVVGVGRRSQGLNDMQAGAIADIPAVIANCDQALSQAERQAKRRPSQVVVGIAGELIKGITNTTQIERAAPQTPLDSDEIDRILKATQAQAYKQAQQETVLELGGQKVDLHLINSALVSILIDGYKVTNPLGFQGRQIDTQLYSAFAPLVHTGAIERVVRELELDLLAVAAEPFAVARSVIGDDQNAALNAILIDIGGGTTDIAVLRDGGLEATKSFAIGGCSFTRSLVRGLNLEYEEAETKKLDYSNDEKMTVSQRQSVKKVLDQAIEVWLQGVRVSLKEFSWLEYFPSQILLAGGGSSLPNLQRALSGPHWFNDLPFSRKPQIQQIETSQIPGLDDRTGQVTDHTMVTALGLARVANDTINTTSNTKKKGKK